MKKHNTLLFTEEVSNQKEERKVKKWFWYVYFDAGYWFFSAHDVPFQRIVTEKKQTNSHKYTHTHRFLAKRKLGERIESNCKLATISIVWKNIYAK